MEKGGKLKGRKAYIWLLKQERGNEIIHVKSTWYHPPYIKRVPTCGTGPAF